ncbi:sodium:solute symporter [Candidatus Methylacidithermus pantelleriae]|uniref:Sodium transporter n=1 Tax=Candidatus Methylacidithermus pantelleriae TaxID=2744239 RepID=A0A8J2FSH4_9BACT|nr:sodium:solute symporter [Candidatus Methylacidithermus pantelleriae]CAF0698770.1 Sodium transporter [Candidatus Methylacidithermus pantelleriae]
MPFRQLTFWDWIALAGYFGVLWAIGWRWAGKGKDPATYFLAGRNVGWIPVGASLFISNISTEHVVGLAGAGARSGLAAGQFEWLACPILLLLGWWLAPYYLRLKLYTMPEYVKRRYGQGPALLLSLTTVVTYVLTKVSVHLYAAFLILSPLVGWSPILTSIFLVGCTGLYTVAGGLGAVIYADLFQTVILLAGSFILTWLGLQELGGLANLRRVLPATHFAVWRPASDPDYPWTGIVFGAPILGFWYWCTDQSIVQRVLAARDSEHARAGAILAGFLKLLPVFLFVLPGMIARALFPSELLGNSTTGDRTDLAYVFLVTRLLPPGLVGFSLAGMLAALMGAMSAVFNSTSTLLTMDFYRKLRPAASQRELVQVGRWLTLVTVVLGILWSPLIPHLRGGLFLYLQKMQAYLSPPIAACFLWGMLSAKPNEGGAWVCLTIGLALGLARIGLELTDPFVTFHNPVVRAWIDLPFLHYATFLFVLSSALLWTASTSRRLGSGKRIPAPNLPLVRIGETTCPEHPQTTPSWKIHLLASLLLLLVLICLWMYFA